MKQLVFLSILFITACGDDPAPVDSVNSAAGFLTGPILYPDDGVSNRLFSCNEAAQRIRDGVELGMTYAEVRSIVGKPRHISPVGNDWRYGTSEELGEPFGDTPDDFFVDFYFLPATNFITLGIDSETGQQDDETNSQLLGTFLDDFSGDNTLCDDTDLSFIEAANSYAQTAGDIDFSDEITSCSDAAIRIAGSVEQGMSLNQVRQLVGKPVEVARDGTHWRYEFGRVDVPFVFFTQYLADDTYFVTGYSSINNDCQS